MLLKPAVEEEVTAEYIHYEYDPQGGRWRDLSRHIFGELQSFDASADTLGGFSSFMP